MEEFFLAHHKVISGKPNYLIPVLMEELDIDQLPRDLQTYVRTHTYTDGREFDLDTLRKRIRFSMPDVPLSQLRRRQQIEAGVLGEDELEMEANDVRAVGLLKSIPWNWFQNLKTELHKNIAKFNFSVKWRK